MKITCLVLCVFLMFSCQKKFSSERASWKIGDRSKTLKFIEQQEWSEKNSEIELKNKNSFEKIVITRQSILGIPIENSYLKKVYKKNNEKYELVSAEAMMLTPPDLKLVAGLSFNENEIIKTIQKMNIKFSKISVINSETIFAVQNKNLVPALKISFFDRLGEPWSAYADQKNNVFNILREGSRFESKTSVEATIYPFGPKQSFLTDVILNNLNIQPTLSTTEAVVTTEADKRITTLDQSLKFDPKDVRFDQVQSFFYLNRSLEWMKQKFGILFPQQLEVVVHVGFPEKTNTAFYFQNKIRLGSGDDEVYSEIPQDPSIISHESFHYLIDNIARLPFESEGGSLNEAFADYFTCVMLNRPHLAEASYLKGPYKRTLEATTMLSEKNGGLYHDSLIVSSMFWELSQKIGSEKILKLATEVLKTLHRYSDFSDFNAKLHEQIGLVLKKEDGDVALQILKKRGFND